MTKLRDNLVDLKKSLGTFTANDEAALIKTNANEVEHTTNTGFGKELVPVDTLSTQIYQNIPEYSRIFDKLMNSFHGNNMGTSEKVGVIWEVGFALGNAEWTTGAGIISQGGNKLGTWEVTINQASLIISVDISKKLANHSIVDVEAYAIAEWAKSLARTMDSMLVNGDTLDTATWNVNCDDAQPTVTFAAWAKDHRLLLDNGIRKLALSGTINVDYVDIWTLSFDDYITVRAKLGDFSYDLENLLLIMNPATYNATLILDEFKQQYQNGLASTIIDGKLKEMLAWVEYVVARDFGLTEADGKQSATASNNTKGWFAYIVKNAVQWWFGQAVETDVVKIPGKWYSVILTMEFGFAIVNKKAGMTSPSCVLAINATV